MAIIVLVETLDQLKSRFVAVKFIPKELATFEGSAGHLGIKADNPRHEAEKYIHVHCYGDYSKYWLVVIDTESPTYSEHFRTEYQYTEIYCEKTDSFSQDFLKLAA